MEKGLEEAPISIDPIRKGLFKQFPDVKSFFDLKIIFKVVKEPYTDVMATMNRYDAHGYRLITFIHPGSSITH